MDNSKLRFEHFGRESNRESVQMLGDIVLIRCHHERVEAIGVDLSMAGPVMASTSPGEGIEVV